MVYRGKPSPRCGRCRIRGLRCSQEKPSCAQCIRARVDCPGYRDLRSLLFVDETKDVSIKAEKKGVTKYKTEKRGKSSRDSNQEAYRTTMIAPLPDQELLFPIHEQALCFVYQNYLQKWLWLYGDGAVRDDNLALSSAITALGLSAMANMRMSPPLMMAAREEYTKALAATNQNIKDPVLSKTDQTLVAVMFLGMFEVVTYTDPESIFRWMKHIEGATKLLEWRGEDQLKSSRGSHLFRLMRGQIVTHDIFKESQTSPIVIDLSQKACDSGDGSVQYADQLANINIQLSRLCENIRCGELADPAARIGFALALDAEMEAWSSSVPCKWGFETITLPLESLNRMNSVFGIYGNKYHIYKDLYSCGVWNNWRGARMVLHEIILNSCNLQEEVGGDTEPSAQLFGHSKLAARSEAVMKVLIEDICASVPYHFGISSNQSSMESVGTNEPATVAGHILIWPLFLAADSIFASPDLKIWVIMCLEKIGHGMGIGQALAMANLLREGAGVRTWIQPAAALIID
ncbi:Zn(II)2Cys6 transcription factor [Talaromyces proteolyticus]|uniref:Zn(II)2Cys6 transcription factor n=1 Tax=Talaromyces proteolyticus TaxID=1131652 RepID=A0AAD4KIV0_9EURO|nr:Zn(II)2Cys6 transcription factor [Talaromyces proteolyticus]KAH8691338.1 Zn(II)2Cys6 transcription factor [Talaromyces proteolyticus]